MEKDQMKFLHLFKSVAVLHLWMSNLVGPTFSRWVDKRHEGGLRDSDDGPSSETLYNRPHFTSLPPSHPPSLPPSLPLSVGRLTTQNWMQERRHMVRRCSSLLFRAALKNDRATCIAVTVMSIDAPSA